MGGNDRRTTHAHHYDRLSAARRGATGGTAPDRDALSCSGSADGSDYLGSGVGSVWRIDRLWRQNPRRQNAVTIRVSIESFTWEPWPQHIAVGLWLTAASQSLNFAPLAQHIAVSLWLTVTAWLINSC